MADFLNVIDINDSSTDDDSSIAKFLEGFNTKDDLSTDDDSSMTKFLEGFNTKEAFSTQTGKKVNSCAFPAIIY